MVVTCYPVSNIAASANWQQKKSLIRSSTFLFICRVVFGVFRSQFTCKERRENDLEQFQVLQNDLTTQNRDLLRPTHFKFYNCTNFSSFRSHSFQHFNDWRVSKQSQMFPCSPLWPWPSSQFTRSLFFYRFLLLETLFSYSNLKLFSSFVFWFGFEFPHLFLAPTALAWAQDLNCVFLLSMRIAQFKVKAAATLT